MYRF